MTEPAEIHAARAPHVVIIGAGPAGLTAAYMLVTRYGITSTVLESAIMDAVRDVFDLTPKGIITALDLRKPIYSATSAYGHFGREPKKVGRGKNGMTEFSCERTDRASALARAVR